MKVAYRESVGETVELELELEKVIDKESLYAKIKLGLESTLMEFDVAEIQKRKFDGEEEEGEAVYEMSKKSFDIQNEDNDSGQTAAVIANLS